MTIFDWYMVGIRLHSIQITFFAVMGEYIVQANKAFCSHKLNDA